MDTNRFNDGLPSSQSLSEDMKKRLENIGHDFDALRNQFSKWMKELQDSLNHKSDNEALQNLEKALIERMNEMVKALAK